MHKKTTAQQLLCLHVSSLFHHLVRLLHNLALCPTPLLCLCMKGASFLAHHIILCSVKGQPTAFCLRQNLFEILTLSSVPESCNLKSCIVTELFLGLVRITQTWNALGRGGDGELYELRRDRLRGMYSCIIVCYKHIDGKMHP